MAISYALSGIAANHDRGPFYTRPVLPLWPCAVVVLAHHELLDGRFRGHFGAKERSVRPLHGHLSGHYTVAHLSERGGKRWA